MESVGSGQRGVLVHVKPQAKLVRGKVRAGLRQVGLETEVPSATWSKAWVVDCRPVGTGDAALTYLAPYVFRVALSNKRIVGVANDQVTFRYRDGATKKTKRSTLPATEFIGRFLQHVLPKGFVKVRYFGLFRSSNRPVLAQVRATLAGPVQPCPIPPAPTVGAAAADELSVPPAVRCPLCGAQMELTQSVQPTSRSPPPVLAFA